MRTGRPKTPIVLTADERTQLQSLARSRALPHALVARADLVLWAAQGKSNSEIADRLHCAKTTVGKWRQRFLKYRVAGLYDELRPGRPRSIEDDRVAALLNQTISPQLSARALWTVRQAAQASGISKSTVHRLFQAFAVQPALQAQLPTFYRIARRKNLQDCRSLPESDFRHIVNQYSGPDHTKIPD